MSTTIKLTEKVLIKGTIETLTGLHVGGSNTELSIGGINSAIIRNPITKLPYIPGSSIKGKMRSLVELGEGTIHDDGEGKNVRYTASRDPKAKSSQLFGFLSAQSSEKEEQRPSRLIVRDADLTEESQIMFKDADLLYAEVKTEVVIDRITSAAMPRQIERVPAGAKFKLDLVINVFDENDDNLIDTALNALLFLQDDYVGGNGSRGYGQIKIQISEMTQRSKDFYLGDKEEDKETLKNKYKDQERYKSLFIS